MHFLTKIHWGNTSELGYNPLYLFDPRGIGYYTLGYYTLGIIPGPAGILMWYERLYLMRLECEMCFGRVATRM